LDTVLDPFQNGENIKLGYEMAIAHNDWTIKLDMVGLDHNTQYVFAFLDEHGVASPVGMTKTAPAANEEVENLSYAVFSCSNWGFGYFHAYNVSSSAQTPLCADVVLLC